MSHPIGAISLRNTNLTRTSTGPSVNQHVDDPCGVRVQGHRWAPGKIRSRLAAQQIS